MHNIFSVAEVVDMGIEKEKKRRDFYDQVSKTFKQRDIKELFSRLRDWEQTHIKKFTAIRNSVDDSETTESFEGEMEAYMKALVDDRLYKDVSPRVFSKNVRNAFDAIRYGMEFEKDAILFFRELADKMIPHHQEKIEELINEEKRHLIYLSELKTRYEK